MNATRPRVLIVPTLDEAASIEACLEALATLNDCDVLVIDDASPDGTADVARAWSTGRRGVNVVSRPDVAVRPGLGHALRYGFDVAATLGYRAACVFDADLQQRPMDARRLLDAVEAGADIAIGSRWMARAPDEGLHERSSRVASALLRRVFGVDWRDATTDFMAMRMECWTPGLAAAVNAAGLFAAFEIRWRIARAGWTVVEIAVPWRPRSAGHTHGSWRRTAGWAKEVVALAASTRRAEVRAKGRQSETDSHARTRFASPMPGTVVGGEPDRAGGAPTVVDVPGPQRVARMLASGESLKLHLACGKRYFPGWVHVDVDDWPHVDLVQTVESLPLPDGSASIVYNCHQIAYFDRVTVLDVLAEWRRVLQPGGILRIATADFEAVAAEYALGRPLVAFDGLLHGRYPVRASSARRLGLSMDAEPVPIYYRTTYDFQTLGETLRQAGFEAVRRYDWRATEHAEIDDYSQAYLPHMDKENGRSMSLNVEARKPLA